MKKIVILLFLALVAVAVIATIARSNKSGPSRECEQISREVASGLSVGMDEAAITPFFEKHRWKYGAAVQLGLYSVDIDIKKTLFGDHVVRVYVEAKGGVIQRIEVTDLT